MNSKLKETEIHIFSLILHSRHELERWRPLIESVRQLELKIKKTQADTFQSIFSNSEKLGTYKNLRHLRIVFTSKWILFDRFIRMRALEHKQLEKLELFYNNDGFNYKSVLAYQTSIE